MVSTLEKARQDPSSMKGKILAAARKVFGEYGYHGTTTRMIAKEVGIDISTLYYHWGEKRDLYEAVVMDLNEEIRQKLLEIENKVKGKSLAIRLEIAIDVMCDYLFSNPEVSSFILFLYFGKTKGDASLNFKVSEYISNIAIAMGLALDKKYIPVKAKASVIAVWNSVLNFISGEDFFRPMLDIGHDEYIVAVKDTLKFILIPAFTQKQG